MGSFTPRALIFGDSEKPAYFRLLKDFLFKLGLRETTGVSSPADIAQHLQENIWPILLVDHTEGQEDGFVTFERLQKTLGFELLPILVLAPQERVVFGLFGVSAGARGVLAKPLQPQEAARMFRALIPPAGDPATTLALQVSRLLLKGELAKAMPALTKLAAVPVFKRHAEVALARCEMKLGLMAQANQRLMRLAQKEEPDIRILCEIAEFHKSNAQHSLAISAYKRIHALHPQLHIKTWDQILLHVELDELDEAALLLDELQGNTHFRDSSTEGLARLMYFMGLTQSVANVLKMNPEALKNYYNWLNVCAKARG